MVLHRPVELAAETGQVESPPNAPEVPLLEIVSSRSTLLAEERGSLTGNQWVGGTSPPPFANCFNELALPNL
jgi:hypothetical protein